MSKNYSERKEYFLKRRREFMKKAVAYKGGKCENCGKEWFMDGFDFHHVDRNSKSFGIAGNLTRKWDDIKAELDKCVLLCNECHRKTFAP